MELLTPLTLATAHKIPEIDPLSASADSRHTPISLQIYRAMQLYESEHK